MTSEPHVQTLDLAGERNVLLREVDYCRLTGEAPEPKLPPSDAEGCYPALESMHVLLARDILRSRRKLGLSQAELARRAGVRVETLCRIERGQHAPTVATIDKLDRALRKVEAQTARRSTRRRQNEEHRTN